MIEARARAHADPSGQDDESHLHRNKARASTYGRMCIGERETLRNVGYRPYRSPERINRYRDHVDSEDFTRNSKKNSGEGEIRTRGTVTRPHDFQSCTFGHSVTSPKHRREE